MTVERALRMMAGIMIILSVALAYLISPWWLLLAAFVGLNLFQSSFSNWCPAMNIFEFAGLKRCVALEKSMNREDTNN